MTQISRNYLIVEDIAQAREWLVDSIANVFDATAHAATTSREARDWLRQCDQHEAVLALVDLDSRTAMALSSLRKSSGAVRRRSWWPPRCSMTMSH